MANQRSESQTLLAFTIDRQLADKVDRLSRKAGKNRSQFIREALAEFLRDAGEEVSLQEVAAPDRRKPVPATPVNFRNVLASDKIGSKRKKSIPIKSE